MQGRIGFVQENKRKEQERERERERERESVYSIHIAGVELSVFSGVLSQHVFVFKKNC